MLTLTLKWAPKKCLLSLRLRLDFPKCNDILNIFFNVQYVASLVWYFGSNFPEIYKFLK